MSLCLNGRITRLKKGHQAPHAHLRKWNSSPDLIIFRQKDQSDFE